MGYIGSGPTKFNTADGLTVTGDAEFTGDTIVASGNLGIGTASPSEVLEVYGTTPIIQINDRGLYQAQIGLIGNDTEFRGSSGSIEFYTGSNDGASSSERMRIDSSGNVGIDFTPKTMTGNVTSSLNVGSGTVFQRTKDTFLASNMYYNSSDAGTSISTGYGLAYYQNVTNGSHQWFTSAASAGSADAAHSFTIPMTIDSSGRVAMPNQPSFSVTRSQGDVSSGTYVFANTFHNTGNHYSTTTGRFTAPITGLYFFSTNMMSSNAGTYNNAYYDITKNGSTIQRVYSSNGASVHHRWNWSGVIYLNANDYIAVDKSSSSSLVLYGGGNDYTSFTGFFVG